MDSLTRPWAGVLAGLLLAGAALSCGGDQGPEGAPAGVQATTSHAPLPSTNVGCDPFENLAVHYHVHLRILVGNVEMPVPGFIGRGSPQCLYWLHTHDSSGVIHVEAPAEQRGRAFHLSDFFAIWQQPLSSAAVGTRAVRPDEHVFCFVDGSAYLGEPGSVVLRDQGDVVLEVESAPVSPPTYTWPTRP